MTSRCAPSSSLELGQLPFAADKRGHPHRQVRQRTRQIADGRPQPGVLPQDGLLQVTEVRGRIEAQLIVESLLQPAVGGQRVGLPAASVQRQHQLSVDAFAQRVAGRQLLQLVDQLAVPAPVQLQADAFLDGGEAELLEVGHLGHGPRLTGEVGQGGAAP